jgi:hypothetical protein
VNASPTQDNFAVTVRDGCTEDLFAQKNFEARVQNHPVSRIGQMRFGLVEPIVNGLVILGLTAVFSNAREHVMKRMRHAVTS